MACALAGLWLANTSAQTPDVYPVKPIRLVVSFPPGGSTDVVARIVTPRMAERLGQNFVVDNRPGAGGIIAVETVTKSSADGYTLLLGTTGTMAINVSLYKKLPYDPQRDLAAVSGMAKAPFVLLVPSQGGPQSLQELIAAAKANPAKLSYGSGGNGSAMHLSGELFKMLAGVNLLHVPFKSSGLAAVAMLGGELNAVWADLASAQTALRTGKARVLAISATERSPLLPDVPTLVEAGVAGYESIGWFGLFAPGGTPKAVIARLHAESAASLQQNEVRERIMATGNEPWVIGPDQLARFARSEIAKWAGVVKASGASVD